MRLIIRTETKFILLERKRIMKNLRKALALFVAAAAVFGTVASAADMSVFKAQTSDNATTAWGSNSYSGGGVLVGGTHTKSRDAETGVITLTTDRTSLENKGTVGQTLIHRGGIYGHEEETLVTVGNCESEIQFEYNVDIDGDPETGKTLQVLNAFTLKFGVGYYPSGSDTLSFAQGNAGLSVGTSVASENSGFIMQSGADWVTKDNIKLTLCGKESGGFALPMNKKMSLKLNANTFQDYATLVLYNMTDDVELARVEVTPSDDIDIYCVKNGMNIIMQDVFNFTLYKATHTNSEYFAYNQQIDDSGATITATADLARNANHGITYYARGVLVQYDADGNFLQGDMSDIVSTTGSGAVHRETGVSSQGQVSMSVAKAERYHHAKFMVWDGRNNAGDFRMDPLTYVVSSN